MIDKEDEDIEHLEDLADRFDEEEGNYAKSNKIICHHTQRNNIKGNKGARIER